MTQRLCTICSKKYLGGTTAKYCLECKEERIKELHKRTNLRRQAKRKNTPEGVFC